MFGHLLTQEVTLESSPLTSLCELARTFARDWRWNQTILWNTQTSSNMFSFSSHVAENLHLMRRWMREWWGWNWRPHHFAQRLEKIRSQKPVRVKLSNTRLSAIWKSEQFCWKLGFEEIKHNTEKAILNQIYFVVFVFNDDAVNVDVYADLDVDEWRYRFEQAG